MKLTGPFPAASAAALAVCTVTAGALGRLSAGTQPGGPAVAAGTPVVVELFTSEGCSSCPPADAYLRDLAEAGASQGVPVVVLGEHVDYWNRLGWKDPFSSSGFTARQSWYSGRLSSQVYTPQLVVDGQWETIGSDRPQATADIARAATSRKASVSVTLAASGSVLSIGARVAPGALDRLPDADVYVALTESGLASRVTAGENAGRRLEHAAVTRRLEKAGQIKAGSPGAHIDASLPLDPSWDATRSSVVVFVQERKTGAIVGAWGGPLPAGARLGLAAPRPGEPQPGLHHYVFFGFERGRISDPEFLATAALEGAQLKYSWRELEPRPGRYDFTSIHHDLSTLSAAGKRLFVQVQDISFTSRPNVPDYLLHDSRYGGGVAPEYTFDDEETESHPVRDGWVARRWDPAVRERFALLLGALAGEFDGRIAGLNLAETSVGFGDSGRYFPTGFSHEAYYTSILAMMTTTRAAFQRSDAIVYANFMPGEALPDNDHGYLRGVYRHARQIGMGVGGPDLLPYRWFQRQHSLRLIAERPVGTVAGLAVQDGNLADVNRRTGKRVTVADLVRIARDELRLDYVFWGTEEPYWSRDVLPYLRALRQSAAAG